MPMVAIFNSMINGRIDYLVFFLRKTCQSAYHERLMITKLSFNIIQRRVINRIQPVLMMIIF